jgi:hypothetical protein
MATPSGAWRSRAAMRATRSSSRSTAMPWVRAHDIAYGIYRELFEARGAAMRGAAALAASGRE